ncbi:hypothetical protein J437_LFUL017027 [Ladona fulva]|uniref:TGF-beta family profile domain-containing protein n=1 Tax=Ladona fulva TaxID=123851 RepID=A0A8K0P6F5_LADFU|nr:hypothetical protein J437_LFUL017027 [Ladona fulva]
MPNLSPPLLIPILFLFAPYILQRTFSESSADLFRPAHFWSQPRSGRRNLIPKVMLEILEKGGEERVRSVLPAHVDGQEMAHVFLLQGNKEAEIQRIARLDSRPIRYHQHPLNTSSFTFIPKVSLNVTEAIICNNLHQKLNPKKKSLIHLELHLRRKRKFLSLSKKQQSPFRMRKQTINELPDPPLLLLFYSLERQQRKNQSDKPKNNWRWKRSNEEDFEEETNMIWSRYKETTRVKDTNLMKRKVPKNLCRRHSLYIDFAEINYDSWIVAPNGYEVSIHQQQRWILLGWFRMLNEVAKIVPGGAPSVNSAFILLRGNINIGGTKVPPADMHITAVVVSPRSPDTILPTWRLPFLARTPEFLEDTVPIEVSSTLKIRWGGYC